MSIVNRWREWRRRRRLEARFKKRGELREFVYLDEVSLYSLMASRYGAITSELTETETASLRADIGGALGSGLERSAHVVRKSIVQSTFRDFYQQELPTLAIRPLDAAEGSPGVSEVDEVATKQQLLMARHLLIDPNSLSRGQLVEMEVELQAESIFQVSAVISALLELVEDDADLFGLDPSGNVRQMKSIGRILQKLMVGLVPIRARAVDYVLVALHGKDWLVHRTLYESLKSVGLSAVPLYIVGVAAESLFWKDIRRVLFSQGRFRVLCRLAQLGVQEKWIPVKLSQVLDFVVPGLGSKLDAVGSGLLSSMAALGRVEAEPGISEETAREVLVRYATLLFTHLGKENVSVEMGGVGMPSVELCQRLVDPKSRLRAFDEMAGCVERHCATQIDREIVAVNREFAANAFGVSVVPGIRLARKRDQEVQTTIDSGARFIDTEFVAMYW